jgi:TRAP-type mannitol/chloroaromatic compound transport system permease small subunit
MNPQQRVTPAADVDPSMLDLEKITHHTRLPDTAFSLAVDRIIERLGAAVSWLWLALVVVIVTNVVQRYFFGTRIVDVDLEEVAWHLYGVGFLIGLSYTLRSDHHVRVDILHEHFTLRTQAWIEWVGLIALAAFLIVVLRDLLPYAHTAYQAGRVPVPADAGVWESLRHWLMQGERAQSPSGLPARWLLKFVIPIAFGLLLVAGFARWLRCCALLFGFPRPRFPVPTDGGDPSASSLNKTES